MYRYPFTSTHKLAKIVDIEKHPNKNLVTSLGFITKSFATLMDTSIGKSKNLENTKQNPGLVYALLALWKFY